MKTNQFRAMMLVLLMAVISLGRMNAQVIIVFGTDQGYFEGCNNEYEGPVHNSG